MNKYFKKTISFFILSLITLSIAFFSGINIGLADGDVLSPQDEFKKIGGHAFDIQSQTGEPHDIRITIARAINVILGLIATILLILTVIAGFKWMTAGGNQEQVGKAKSDLKNAFIGLIIILLSWSISWFILIRLQAITDGRTQYLNPPFH